MGMEALFQGLQMFQQGLQQYSTGKAISDATDALQKLNESTLSEQEKRAEQMKLSNQVALQLTGLGASGTQIQAASGALKPASYTSPEEMAIQGYLTGNKGLIEGATATRKMLDQSKFDLQKMQGQQAMDLQRLKSAGDLQQEYLKGSMKVVEPVKVDPKEADFLTNVKSGIRYSQTLEKAVEDAGTWEGFRGLQNADAAAKMQSVPYQLAITYAKIKDPGSVVSGKEADKAEEVLAQLGFFRSSAKAKSAMNYIRGDMKQIYKDRRDSYKEFGGKYPDLKSIEHTPAEAKSIGRPMAPEGSGLAPGERVVQRPDPKNPGKTVPVVYDAAGKPLRLYPGAE